FAARAREFGMLQSLGYARRAIVLSLIQEALLTIAIAVFAAIILARLLLDGAAIAFSMGVFQITINNLTLAAGSAAGLFLGLIGVLPPAWRCLRMGIPEAL